jgi:MFS transporter, DHA2 family, multidrug resistance protein
MDPESSDTDAAERRAAHKWLIALAVMLGATLEVLDTSIVNVALPYMQGSFSATADEITWILTSYLVSNGVMIPLTGWISARFGRKRYFIASIAVFVIASGMCGAAATLDQMVVFRLIQGAAGAAMIPSSQAILMETFPPAEQGLAMATWGVGLMLAPIMGPTLGGWITVNWNWRWNFYINLPTGVMAALMVYAFVEDPPYLGRRSKAGKVDYLGILYLTMWLGLLQIVLDRGQRSDWFSAPWVCWFAFFSALGMILLIFRELRFSDPILDLRIVGIRDFTTSVALVSVMMFLVYGVNLMNPLFLQELMGYDAWKAGLAVAPRGIGVMVSMIAVGQLSRLGYDTRPGVGIGFVLAAVAAWEMAGWNLDVSLEAILWPIVLFGFGGGLIFPVISATALACVERSRMGFAASLYNMVRNTAAAVGISLVSNRLVSGAQIHQSYLVAHFTPFEAWRMSQAPARMPGSPPFNFMHQLVTGQHQSLGMVYRMIQDQALLLAYNDVYRMFAYLALLFVPGCILLSRVGGAEAGAAH